MTADSFPDDGFLVEFYENALGFKHTALSRESMICTALFDEPTLLRNIDPAEVLRR